MVGRAIRVALVVGPVLVIVNNFDFLVNGSLPDNFWLKSASTFVVPFLVSLYSSIQATRKQASEPGPTGDNG